MILALMTAVFLPGSDGSRRSKRDSFRMPCAWISPPSDPAHSAGLGPQLMILTPRPSWQCPQTCKSGLLGPKLFHQRPTPATIPMTTFIAQPFCWDAWNYDVNCQRYHGPKAVCVCVCVCFCFCFCVSVCICICMCKFRWALKRPARCSTFPRWRIW
ncbi:hypothetical protein K470DRAFT_286457 [Piedraia hortae CBS 480.64]|uniref:Uncharacterized protein n=1 Tax=Piedraia hortae CBS 480.64 TaxID=1314780 RepID=A0A6A7BZV7_9PEZI|nr:hypothetical protein K470DRAFT_286457 [Piedraia hortae CBS 480.64]